MRRWWVVPVVLAVVLGGFALVRAGLPCAVLEQQPSCYVVLRPGPVQDTLRLVDVEGAPTYGSAGELLLTTVAVDEQLDFGEWLRASMSDRVEAVPRSQVFPPDSDREEATDYNAALMVDSQLTATVEALETIGYDVHRQGALVAAVAEDAATDVLEVGDVITEVEGTPVEDSRAVVAIVAAHEPGEVLRLEVDRDDAAARTVEVRLGTSPDDPSRAYIGVLLSTALDLPVDVEIDAGVIGGPSAGLMFALAIIEVLDVDDLTGGAVVAGTGTLDADGRVGPVGGVRQKVLGATGRDSGQRRASAFLVPRDNFDEARAVPVDDDVLLVPVDTLDTALTALEDLREGREPDGAVRLAPAATVAGG